MAEPNLIYKVSVLCLLSKADSPLTNAQIAQFYLDGEYTDYFNIQQILGDLVESGFVEASSSVGNTLYTVTEKGLQTLRVMSDKLTDGIEEDIVAYLDEIHVAIRYDNAVTATYDRDSSGGFIVHLKSEQGGHQMLDIDMHVPLEQQAVTICTNWRAKSDFVYEKVMEELL